MIVCEICKLQHKKVTGAHPFIQPIELGYYCSKKCEDADWEACKSAHFWMHQSECEKTRAKLPKSLANKLLPRTPVQIKYTVYEHFVVHPDNK